MKHLQKWKKNSDAIDINITDTNKLNAWITKSKKNDLRKHFQGNYNNSKI